MKRSATVLRCSHTEPIPQGWPSTEGVLVVHNKANNSRPDKRYSLRCAAQCCKMRHMNKTLSPPTKPPRVSVPLDAETLAVFQRLGKAGNMSTGGAIAEWLRDTVEAAEFMASKMEAARAAPKVVMREMHAYAMALADETGDLMRQIAAKGQAERAGRSSAATGGTSAAALPPSCNTGGKVTKGKPVHRPKGVS